MSDTLSPELQATLDTLTDYHRRQLSLYQHGRRVRQSAKDRHGVVRFSRAIAAMMTDRGLSDGPEAEFFAEVAKLRGESFDPHRIRLPLTCLTRDLSAAQATAGGYLVGVDLGEAVEVLRPWSIVVNGGVSVEEQLTGNATVPKTVAGVTITWQPTETTEASPSNPTISQAALTPHVGIGIVTASRNFMVQADPERWLRRELARVAGVAVDTAVLTGTGANGQPLGILNTAGLSAQSGTSLAWPGVLAMKKNAAAVDAPDASIAFISTPAIRATLEAREKASGNGGFIWQDDRIANCPAYASTLMPAGTMLSGPFAGITLGVWSDLRIEINPYDATMFKTGAVQIRVLVACDVAITAPLAAFTVASSIT